MGNRVTFIGTPGVDWSINAAAIPIVGLSLLQTIPANSMRNNIEVQNQSTNMVQLVRDNGSGTQQSSIILPQAISATVPGGDWSSQTFHGVLYVYGTPGSQIAIMED